MPEPDQQLDRGDLDLDYRQEYLKWVSSLSSVDRRQLIALNLDKPHVERTTFVHARAETFRDSPSMVGIEMDDHGEGWRPGLPAEEDEREPEPIDEDDLDRLKCHDPEILRTLIRVLLFPDEGRAGNYKSAFARLIALASVLHVHGVGDKSLEYLAGKIGCTRALLSYYCVQLRDFGRLDCHGGKSVEARACYAVSQLWRKTRTARERREAKKAGELPGNNAEDALVGTLEAKDGR